VPFVQQFFSIAPAFSLVYPPATVASPTTLDPLVPPAPRSASGALQIAAATIGNALEWYDILIYGYLATTLAGVFFPNSNPVVSLLLTFGSFGLSYLARPIGAIVLGAYADRAGRKAALTLSIGLMVMGTAVLAFMPSYASVGLIAPIAVFAARLLQGFAVAGEFGSSTAFMIEHSARRKAFFASWQFAGQQMAKLMAALFGVGLMTMLTGHQLHNWGWRIPFIFGLLVGPIGLYIRRKVDEAPEFMHSTHTRTPVREVFATEKMGLLLGAGLVAVGTAETYFTLYVPTFATTRLHLPPSAGYIVTIVLSLIMAVLCPVAGTVADKIGYTRLMLPAVVLMLLSSYPLFLLITLHPGLPTLMGGLIWDALLQTAYLGALPAMMANIFPARTRVTGLSLSYNLGVTLFGGFAPAIFTWLTAATHNNASPSFYLMATAVVSIVAVVAISRRDSHA
jgi:MFS transporter, MHS family, proline/betaine transporter